MKPLQKKLIALSQGLYREAGDLPQNTVSFITWLIELISSRWSDSQI